MSRESSEKVKEAWKDYWARTMGNEVFLDEMSETIFKELLNSSGGPAGKKILEAGCGRGIISAELAALGADMHLLDISGEALDIAGKYFASKNLSASFIQGDILNLPFSESTFDIVWNGGVMEHFEEAPQAKILQGIARIIKPGGLFITFNPFEGAYFYVWGKRHAERRGRWPYGPEFPVRTLRQGCRASGLNVLTEYQICFRENLSYLSYVSRPLLSVAKRIAGLFPDRYLLDKFGGYLLVTVAAKER